MRKSYSAETERKVIELYCSGDSTNQVHEKLGVSVGYVSEVIAKYSEKLGKSGIFAMHELNNNLGKLGIGAREALVGSNIFSMIKNSGIKPERLSEFIESVFNDCEQAYIEPKEIISIFQKISKIQEATSVPLESLPDTCNELLEKRK